MNATSPTHSPTPFTIDKTKLFIWVVYMFTIRYSSMIC
nr:MAG TPA: hypothetical protein [Caudoviricetes sp.]